MMSKADKPRSLVFLNLTKLS